MRASWNHTLPAIAMMLLAPIALAQDVNRPPSIEIISWTVIRSGELTTVYDRDAGIGSRFAIGGFTHEEEDVVAVTVESIDPDWEDADDPQEGNADQEEVFFRVRFFPTEDIAVGDGVVVPANPPATPIQAFVPNFTLGEFFGTGEGGFGPTGDPLTIQETLITFTLPQFNGRNQSRLNGTIDYDVQYTIQVSASNEEMPENEGLVRSDGATINVIESALFPPSNPQAQADAGSDVTVAAGTTVTLDGSGTFEGFNIGFNPENSNIIEKDDITFTWEFLNGPVSVDPTQSAADDPLATVTLNVPGIYVFRLLADDNVNALPSSDTITITVLESLPADNAPSAIILGPAEPVPVGTIVTLDGSTTTDADCNPNCADVLDFKWRQTNALFEPLDDIETGFLALTTLDQPITQWQAIEPGTYYFRLLVEDGTFLSTTTFSVEVVPAATGGETVDATNEATDNPLDFGPVGTAPAMCGAGLLPLALTPFALGLWRMRRR